MALPGVFIRTELDYDHLGPYQLKNKIVTESVAMAAENGVVLTANQVRYKP